MTVLWYCDTSNGGSNANVSGKDVNSAEKPFGNQPLLADIEESHGMLGLHVTLGGVSLKAWMKQEGASTELHFSNGGT